MTDKAGCLLHGLLSNHGFHDANKRTAWIVCNAFLYTENHALVLPDGYAWYDHLAHMVEDRWNTGQITNWLAQYVKGFDSEDAMMAFIDTFHG